MKRKPFPKGKKVLIQHALIVQITKTRPSAWYHGLKNWVFAVIPHPEDKEYYKVLADDVCWDTQTFNTAHMKPKAGSTCWLIKKTEAMYIGRVRI